MRYPESKEKNQTVCDLVELKINFLFPPKH